MSSPQERLFQVHQAFYVAKNNRAGDLARAADPESAQRVLDNLDDLHAAYFDAAAGELANASAEVESAYASAVTANDKISKARASANKILELIELTAQAADTVAKLVQVANGAGG